MTAKNCAGADLGGGGGEGGAALPFRQVITQKKAQFCCSQTVKSNICFLRMQEMPFQRL